MRTCGFSDASLAASKKYEFGAHVMPLSNTSRMICWGETALPSFRMRSDATATHFFQSVIRGLRVMMTVDSFTSALRGGKSGLMVAETSAAVGSGFNGLDKTGGEGSLPVPAG